MGWVEATHWEKKTFIILRERKRKRLLRCGITTITALYRALCSYTYILGCGLVWWYGIKNPQRLSAQTYLRAKRKKTPCISLFLGVFKGNGVANATGAFFLFLLSWIGLGRLGKNWSWSWGWSRTWFDVGIWNQEFQDSGLCTGFAFLCAK